LFGKKSLIPFLTAGHPDLEMTREIILELSDLGIPLVEVGIPFSDPIADGPVIQHSSFEALRHGYGMNDYIRMVREVRRQSEISMIFMTYLNPIVQFGFHRLDQDASQAGLSGVLISDLIPEEYTAWRKGEYGQDRSFKGFSKLKTVFLAAPTSTHERIRLICEASTGFVYIVARTGVTGKKSSIDLPISQMVEEVRKNTPVPVAVGFGIRSREDVEKVWSFADGAVVGTAIVDFIERNKDNSTLPSLVSAYVKDQLLP
jgi:tryptophan synthase alpha chain